MTTAYNLRICYNNAADRNNLFTASNTAGSLAVTNLLTDIKSEVWRSTTNTPYLTLTWPTTETFSCVAFPFGSFTSTCAMRVKVFTLAGDASPVYDSGWKLCSPSSLQGYSADWGVIPFGVNAYSYGGSSAAVMYFPAVSGQKVIILFDDSASGASYIEAGKIVLGPYFSPTYNPAHGSVKVGVGETSKNERSDAGDLRTDRGSMFKTLSLDLSLMPSQDRDYIWRIARGNGMYKPMWVSLAPENTDTMEEQIFSIYGKLTKGAIINYTYMNQFATSLDLEEI
jgi:hypothetical protein